MAKSKPNPRNQHRGTRLSQFRLRAETLAHLETIRAHLSGRVEGVEITGAEVVRRALARWAEEISAAENARIPSVL